ncbi:MAG: hypothetical protein JWL76_2292 [Thermoleophilia bacterium]|nr:hypothetical protein [Thermoleophilia bacterium]
MVNSARTHKIRFALLLLVLSALLTGAVFLVLDDIVSLLVVVAFMCVVFMAGVTMLGWVMSEWGLPKPSKGVKPSTAKDLIARLVAVNRDDLPFEITRDGKDLTAAWKLADDAWWGVFSREGFQAWYRLELQLDPARKTVRAIELVAKRHLHVDFNDVSFEYERFRGWTLFRRDHERYYGFAKAFPPKFGKVSDLDLDTRAFREPILHEIVDAGWRILPCTYSLRAGI